MDIRPYVEQIATADKNTRRKVVLHALQELGCPFVLQWGEADESCLQNIIVQLGQGTPRLVIGAHYDSVPGSTGANDNGSGAAILLDLVRTLYTTSPPAPLDIVFFDLEERERLGSRFYCATASPDDVSAMINLDICGTGDTILIAPKANLEQGMLRDLVSATLEDGARPVSIVNQLPPGDQTSFEQIGVPNITVGAAPREDIPLLETFIAAIQQGQPPTQMPSIAETIHNSRRDSIDVIQETTLQTVRNWLFGAIKQYFLRAQGSPTDARRTR